MNKFFATNQVCQSCGLSRSTILRMEDRGLLNPAFIDPKTGVRRYDNNNVAQIMQLKQEHSSFEFVEPPECGCYAREFHGATAEDSYRAMYGLHHEAVEKGYRLSATDVRYLLALAPHPDPQQESTVGKQWSKELQTEFYSQRKAPKRAENGSLGALDTLRNHEVGGCP